MYSLTRDLIAIDSVTGNELQIMQFLERTLRRRGLHTELADAFPNRPNLLAYYDEPRPRILLNTHTDTVAPCYGPHETATRIYGRGACDTHGILAAMLEAAEVLHRRGVPGLGILLVVDEEGGAHGGAAHAGRTWAEPDLLVVGEPTENRLMTSQKGLLKADLIAGGSGGHSGYPECFDSALDRLITAIRHLQSRDWIDRHSNGGITLNVHITHGGDAYNKIPGMARAGLFFRLDRPQEVVKQWVSAALAELDDDRLSVEWLSGNDPITGLTTVPGFETAVAAYNTDIAHFGWRHCKTCLLGPGSILRAHRDLVNGDWDAGEWIAKDDQRRGAERYVALITRILRTAS